MGDLNKSASLKQLELLKLIYTFRFTTADLLALNLDLQDSTYIHKRLQRLINLGYVARNYSRSYKLLGKPAVYYLTPKASFILRKQKDVSPIMLKNIKKDSKATDRFINHNLNIHRAYLAIRRAYKDKLWTFTASNLRFPEFEYFPKPLPDAFLSLRISEYERGKRKYFFLIYCSSSVPLFAHLRRLKSLIDYREMGEWEDVAQTVLSGLLIVTDTAKFKIILIEKMAQLLYREGHDEDITYFIATLNELDQIVEENDTVWQSISKPTVIRSLQKI